jgi:hypothetical protein
MRAVLLALVCVQPLFANCDELLEPLLSLPPVEWIDECVCKAPVKTLHAREVKRTKHDGMDLHIGLYSDGQVITIFHDEKGRYPNMAQSIITKGQMVSQSTQWERAEVNGETYAKHIHPACEVYSAMDKQFIILKPPTPPTPEPKTE